MQVKRHGQFFYQRVHREVRRKMRAAKEKWIAEKYSATERGTETGNSKQAYNTLKALTRTSQSGAAVVEDKDGKLLTGSEPEVLKRWTDYRCGLYNYELCPNTSVLQETQSSARTPPYYRRPIALPEHLRTPPYYKRPRALPGHLHTTRDP